MDEDSAPSTPVKTRTTSESTGPDSESPEGDGGRCMNSPDQVFSCDTNFNLTKDEVQLLAKLELQNRILESDTKSLNSLSGASTGHSRRSSDTSQVSVTSGTSHPSSLTAGADESGDGAVSSDNDEIVWPLWGKIVNDWDNFKKKQSAQLKELVRKGVPHHFRGIVWQLLCNAQNASVREQYSEFIKSSSPCEKVIRRDIARTYPEHDFFKEKDGLGQESLFNVMKAFSLHDREVGYCQGSAFIVGLLLMQMPEEDAFAVLVKLMEDYRLREMFKPSMAELGLCMFKLEYIVQEQLPELHIHFQSQSFHTSMYASSWFLTLFTTALPLHLACRVMDVFLSEGMEMIFRIAIAILQVSKEELLTLDMEGMLKYFQKEMPAKCETDPDYLIGLASQVKYNAKQMKKLEKDYTAVKTKEQEEMVELRRLRHENRLLRDRIEYLEAECSKLADKLVQGQVIRAQEAEEVFGLKRELAAVKLAEEDTRQRLLESKEIIAALKTGQQAPSLSERAALGVIDALQQELVAVKLREAETHVTVKDLRERIQELEDTNKKLREVTPDSTIAHLQEEMMAAKLREAEATFGMKELKQKVFDLELEFKKMKSQPKEETPPPVISSFPLSPLTARKREQFRNNLNQLQEDLMTVRFREAAAVAELKESRQRTMELESQDQVATNQLKRQCIQLRKLSQKCEEEESVAKKMKQDLLDEKRRYTDLESKMKEDLMMARIREVEQTQQTAELKQKIASLECKNQELLSAGQIQSGEENDEVKAMQDKVAELKVELMRLKILNDNLSSSKSPPTMQNGSICNGNS